MSFDVPHFELRRVKTQRWLVQDRVVLLEFDYVYHDSVDTPGSLALLYDFERGELHSFDSASAWSVWPPEDRPGRKATREEFERLIQGYGPADRREPGIAPLPR